jgi:hypothetical protein
MLYPKILKVKKKNKYFVPLLTIVLENISTYTR